MFLKILSNMQERIQLETARLYKLAGINPLAGECCYLSFPVAIDRRDFVLIRGFCFYFFFSRSEFLNHNIFIEQFFQISWAKKYPCQEVILEIFWSCL